MNVQFTRKIITNRWIFKARWFYAAGILLIGYLTKILSDSNISFPLLSMVLIFVSFILINIGLLYLLKIAEKNNSEFLLSLIGYGQIAIELIFFTYILHLAGGIESVSAIFFFLPVVTSSLIFRTYGGVIVALLSGLIINFSVLAEFYGFVPHVSRYGVNTYEFTHLSISLTKSITTSIFYLVVGFFSGFSTTLLFRQEKLFEDKVKELNKQKEILKLKETELSAANEQRDTKIVELEKFKKQTVGRELKMIELKNKIAELENNVLADN